MTWKIIFSVTYFVSGISLILWSHVVSQNQSELGIFGVTLFGVVTFPSSYCVSYLLNFISSLIWSDRAPSFLIHMELTLILIFGYLQWFYLIPWVFQKFKEMI